MKTIIFTCYSAKDFDKLPIETRLGIDQALSRYIVDGFGDVKKLSGRDGYRLRIGDYRVIFRIEEKEIVILYCGRRQTNTYKN